MRRLLFLLLAGPALVGLGWLALTSFATGPAVASWAPCPRNWGWVDAWRPRVSPLAAVPIRFSDGRAKVCYGRPSLRGRDALGGATVPFGSLWRTGANEPTTLHLGLPVTVGDLYLRPGSYSIYTVPGPELWEIVINRAVRQWGLESEYTAAIEALEVGRFSVPVERLERPVETLTLRAEPAGGDFYWLALEWQTTRLRIPIDGSRSELSPDAPDRDPF